MNALRLVALLGTVCGAWLAAADSPEVIEYHLNSPISPITVGFVKHAVEQARDAHAAALIIRLDTPGGLVDATRSIVQELVSCPIPVIAYVGPSGARAGSAASVGPDAGGSFDNAHALG